MTTIEGDVARMDETTLDRARAGDGDAFAHLVEPHRRELLVHCYRTLGSLHDAEDVLQDAIVKFRRRFTRLEKTLADQGLSPATATRAELRRAWEAAKMLEEKS